jgi:hypothetical protein
MQIELIENPLVLPTRNAQLTTFALRGQQERSRAVRSHSLNRETRSSEEQRRLLLSWRAVLEEIGSCQLGAGQW